MSKRPKRRLLVPWMFVLTSSVVISILENPVHATYKIENGIAASATVDVRSAVCYYTFSGSKYYFGKIEDGLAAAAKTTSNAITVYVIPNLGHSVSIKKNCSIAKNVTLVFPYSGTETSSPYNTAADNSKAKGFADSDDKFGNTGQAAANRKIQVILESGAQLTIENGGALNITGVLGNADSPNAQGQTTGAYTELVMKPKSSIICNGTITCYGYIREDYTEAIGNVDDSKSSNEREGNGAHIDISSTGKITEPLVIYDFRGGSATSSLYKSVFPMNLFDLPQIAPLMNFNAGGQLIGAWNLYAGLLSKSNHQGQAIIIGSQGSGFIQSASGNNGILTFKNTDTSQGTIITNLRNASSPVIQNTHVMDIKIKGDYIFGSLSINVASIATLNSADYFMPMSNIFQIVLQRQNDASKKATKFTIPNRLKLLQGASAIIEEGATAIANNDIAVLSYASNKSVDGLSNDPRPTDYYYKDTSTAKLPDAALVNNGALELNANFGGKITTDDSKQSNATITTGSNFYPYISTTEITSGSSTASYTFTGIADFSDKNHSSISNSSLWSNDSITSDANTIVWKDSNNDSIHGFDISVKTGSTSVTSGQTLNGETKLTFTAVPKPSYFSTDGWNFAWSTNNGSLTNNNGKTVTNNFSDAGDYTITLKATKSGQSFEKSFSFSIKKDSGGGCVLPSTLITMSDGSTKPIEDVHGGDMVLVFNHGTGRYDVAPVMFNDPEPIKQVKVIHCEFDDGTTLGIIDEHGLFDMDLNQYVYITEETMSNYVGHHFFSNQNSLDFNQHRIVTLKRVYIQEEMTACYSITTAKHFNYFTNGLLGLSGGIAGMFNYFDLDADMKVDLVKMKRDIEKYGLFTYDDFKAYLTEEEFEAYNGKYLKVALGKGLLTKRKLEQLIARYGGKAT